jgi:hypothetical protein
MRRLSGKPRTSIWTCNECKGEIALEYGGFPTGGGKRKRGKTPSGAGRLAKRVKPVAIEDKGAEKEKRVKRRSSEVEKEVDENETIAEWRKRLRKTHPKK